MSFKGFKAWRVPGCRVESWGTPKSCIRPFKFQCCNEQSDQTGDRTRETPIELGKRCNITNEWTFGDGFQTLITP